MTADRPYRGRMLARGRLRGARALRRARSSTPRSSRCSSRRSAPPAVAERDDGALGDALDDPELHAAPRRRRAAARRGLARGDRQPHAALLAPLPARGRRPPRRSEAGVQGDGVRGRRSLELRGLPAINAARRLRRRRRGDPHARARALQRRGRARRRHRLPLRRRRGWRCVVPGRRRRTRAASDARPSALAATAATEAGVLHVAAAGIGPATTRHAGHRRAPRDGAARAQRDPGARPARRERDRELRGPRWSPRCRSAAVRRRRPRRASVSPAT